MEKNKHFFNLVILAVILVSLSVAYYFLYSLPHYNKERLKLDKEKQDMEIKMATDKADAEQKKQEEEKNSKTSALAKDIQDDCIKNVQSGVVYYFDKTNTSASPLFYPYENEESFNKNERILTALGAYRDCLNNDPRNDGNNSALEFVLLDVDSAQRVINNFLVSYRDKTPDLCSSFLLSESAKSKCSKLTAIKDE